MSGHTPGPWQAEWPFDEDCGDDRPRYVSSAVATTCPETAVCVLRADQDADARLIAAAPDLLEALKEAANSSGFQYMIFETRAKIDAAIAKAEGRS